MRNIVVAVFEPGQFFRIV